MELIGEQIGSGKPWVAKITGLDPKFGVAREFLHGVRDYSRANSVGSRGIETGWVITEPGIYERNIPTSWKNTDRSYFELRADGTAADLDKIEVIKKLRGEK
jgi:hypothetical protein